VTNGYFSTWETYSNVIYVSLGFTAGNSIQCFK